MHIGMHVFSRLRCNVMYIPNSLNIVSAIVFSLVYSFVKLEHFILFCCLLLS